MVVDAPFSHKVPSIIAKVIRQTGWIAMYDRRELCKDIGISFGWVWVFSNADFNDG